MIIESDLSSPAMGLMAPIYHSRRQKNPIIHPILRQVLGIPLGSCALDLLDEEKNSFL